MTMLRDFAGALAVTAIAAVAMTLMDKIPF